MTVTSALNAMAHAAEALYAKDRTDQTTELAIDGLKAFAEGLPTVVANPNDLKAREETQRGAWACGTVLGLVGMALHHKLCHTLGGSFNLPHAETHADRSAPCHRLQRGGCTGPVDACVGHSWRLRARSGALEFFQIHGRTIGFERPWPFRKSDLDRATEIALKNPYWNPQPVTADGLRALLQNAWAGNAPSV